MARKQWTYTNTVPAIVTEDITIEGKSMASAAAGASITDPDTIRTAGYTNEIPSSADFNFLWRIVGMMLEEIEERGMPRWSALTTYELDSLSVSDTGVIYRSLQITNLNHALTDLAWWAPVTTTEKVRAYASGATSLATGVATVIAFAAEDYDTSAFHDNAVNNSRLTIPANSLLTHVNFQGNISFTPSGAGVTRGAFIYKNGIAMPRTVGGTVLVGVDSLAVSGLSIPCAPGDYFELFGYQDTGGALNTVPNATYLTMVDAK